jgi:hypothetical protein
MEYEIKNATQLKRLIAFDDKLTVRNSRSTEHATMSHNKHTVNKEYKQEHKPGRKHSRGNIRWPSNVAPVSLNTANRRVARFGMII